MKGVPVGEVLAGAGGGARPFATQLVEAAASQQAVADQKIDRLSEGWSLDRMAVVDRLILRLAVAELLDPSGPPVAGS